MSAIVGVGRQRIRGAGDRALALYEGQYRIHAEWDGDARSKKDATAVKRMATEAVGAVRQFEGILSTDDAETLKRSASILRLLADDLDKVAAISRAARADRERRDLKARIAAADQTSAVRWASDDAMRSEAADLAAFLDQPTSQETKAWVLSKHPGCRIVAFPDRMQPGQRLVDMLNQRGGSTGPLALMRRAAEYVLSLEAAQRDPRRRYEDMWQVGMDDYEAWRQWRKELRTAMTPP